MTVRAQYMLCACNSSSNLRDSAHTQLSGCNLGANSQVPHYVTEIVHYQLLKHGGVIHFPCMMLHVACMAGCHHVTHVLRPIDILTTLTVFSQSEPLPEPPRTHCVLC
jgi:hypothetical protein